MSVPSVRAKTMLVVRLQCAVLVLIFHLCSAFSSWSLEERRFRKAATIEESRENNILILDHLNINHEKGRHDWLKAFFVDFLRFGLDPRKMENVAKGKKTIWANIGANQLHLPEGKPDAQVLDGVITLVYPDLSNILERYEATKLSLEMSKFKIECETDSCIVVIDPWGTKFKLSQGDSKSHSDSRGKQPGEPSEGLAISDLMFHVPIDSNLEGIGRFYEQVLGATVKCMNHDSISIEVGPTQTLTFQEKCSTTIESHVDLTNEEVDVKEGNPKYLSNYGPHVSLYVRDLPSSYRHAEALKLAYVNPRFKRRAYTLEEAVDDCMFRCIDVVDPDDLESGPIIKLEHEIRSVVKKDGTKYKSCPFDDIPDGCITILENTGE